MKKKIKSSILVGVLMCSVSYGYYFYQINSDGISDGINNTSRISMEQENNSEQKEDLNGQDNKDSTDVENKKKEENKEKPEQENIKLYATSAVLLDASNNRILYEKDSNKKLAMASTTKIMTLIIALENGNMDDVVTVSSYAARMPDVQLNIRTGEKYKLRDLMYSLMLESHNDSAVAIAEHIGGSVEGFAKLMNQKAEEIGCKDTHFVTPNGLDATDGQGAHSTTAADLARIMSYCIKESSKKDEFLKITRTSNHTFSDIEGKRSFSCRNHNAFLTMMDGALSGKTGFTGKAGYCYVGALERDGRTFIVALLACGWPNNKGYKWVDTKKLMNYGLANYKYRTFDEIELNQGKLEPIMVEDGQTQYIGQTAMVGLEVKRPEYGMLMRDDEIIETEYELKDKLAAPVEAGTVVGEIKYLVDGKICKVDTIVTNGDVEKIDFKWCFDKVINEFLE
ncbi:D-alanyl-D-alanine carboxypeptidase (penicillin-binding protein 5/6) [Mobilisporobacter senegalensis]|uniref:serine-type D-Ala-D-Ala carboxypeptidase n=1 Tax=Mobilisporobacter senegalensis TaxID=1329262 RepID=A0A3N1XW44_9FIRM|nr:D-alanyl-D-alanine carboxypeptidase family protein [Mobilisporobacter senegalensis]ROR29412.1 D-alanyl-D-alanine carboxypeptidase (penicillin-binding protein 5/6) [Mobilisporobacter senegalensis]